MSFSFFQIINKLQTIFSVLMLKKKQMDAKGLSGQVALSSSLLRNAVNARKLSKSLTSI